MRKTVGIILIIGLSLVIWLIGFSLSHAQTGDEGKANGMLPEGWMPQGDMVYLVTDGTLAFGAGLDLAKWNYARLRLEGVYKVNEDAGDKPYMIGAGIGVNVPELVEHYGGKWEVPAFMPEIGVLGMTEITGSFRLQPAVYATLLKVQF